MHATQLVFVLSVISHSSYAPASLSINCTFQIIESVHQGFRRTSTLQSLEISTHLCASRKTHYTLIKRNSFTSSLRTCTFSICVLQYACDIQNLMLPTYLHRKRVRILRKWRKKNSEKSGSRTQTFFRTLEISIMALVQRTRSLQTRSVQTKSGRARMSCPNLTTGTTRQMKFQMLRKRWSKSVSSILTLINSVSFFSQSSYSCHTHLYHDSYNW